MIGKRLYDQRASSEVVDFIYDQTETNLRYTVQLALAADQRALVLAGIFASVGAALLAIGMDSTNSNTLMVVIGLCQIVASLAAFWSARPIPFRTPGNGLEHWKIPLDDQVQDARKLKLQDIQALDNAVQSNISQLRSNSFWLYGAVLLGTIGPLALFGCSFAVRFLPK